MSVKKGDKGEVLPPRAVDEEDDDSPEEEPSPFTKPNPGKRLRRRKRKTKEEEHDEEVTDRALLIELLGKGEKSDRILEIFDKSRQREGVRSTELQNSQRSFTYVLLSDRDKLQAYVDALQAKVLELINQVAELTVKLAEAKGASKVTEIVEVSSVLLQTEIGQALQGVAVDFLQKKKDEKRKELAEENRRLRRLLEAKEKEEKEEERGELQKK